MDCRSSSVEDAEDHAERERQASTHSAGEEEDEAESQIELPLVRYAKAEGTQGGKPNTEKHQPGAVVTEMALSPADETSDHHGREFQDAPVGVAIPLFSLTFHRAPIRTMVLRRRRPDQGPAT